MAFAGLRVTTLGTLASRILGMLRDMATAALFGMSAGGVMDAFVVAFRVPNLGRRLFGEGALTASYLPVITDRAVHDPRRGWQLTSVVFTLLAILLLGLLLISELVCVALALVVGEHGEGGLLLGLTASLLPYMVLICLTAQLAATQYAVGRFTMPALAPVMLNIFWLGGVLWLAPAVTDRKPVQAYILAVCLVVAGVVQLAMQIPPLWRAGFRFDFNWQETRDDVRRIVAAMLPMMFGLTVTQLNTLVDVLIAWGLAATPTSSDTISWLPGDVAYPLERGAAAAIYYAERLQQLPIGLVGQAVATVIFPLLSLHAARGQVEALSHDLAKGLRLVLLFSLPAAAGLIILAEPIVSLLFERGEFTDDDAARTARMIAGYAIGVWAYCALPVLIRGFYATGDRMTPLRVGLAAMAINLTMNLALVWPLGEWALAISTSVSSMFQVVALAILFSRRRTALPWLRIARTVAITSVAAAAMSLVCLAVRNAVPTVGLWNRLVAVLLPTFVGATIYFAALRALARGELRELLSKAR